MSIYSELRSRKAAVINKIYLMLLLISLISLAFGYFVEKVLEFAPCYLCLLQRAPYWSLIVLSVMGYFLKHDKLFLILIILNIFIGLILSGYHTGVERGLFEPSELCKGSIKLDDTLTNEQAKQLLYDSPITSCVKPQFKIFGLSMTEANLLINTTLFVILILIYYTMYIARRQ